MSEPLKLCECEWARTPISAPIHSTSERGSHRISCPCCPASTAWYATEAEAISAWNRRAPLPTVTREELVNVLTHTLLSCDPADGVIACHLTAENAPHELPLAADAVLVRLREKGVVG